MIEIILAEDAAIIRDFIRTRLEQEPDMRVRAAVGSGKELVRAAQDTPFDIALIDVDMETPVAGIIAAGHILSQKPDAKIVFLTVHEEDETILSAIEVGGADYVVKTDDLSEVIEHIRNAYKGDIRMQPQVSNSITKAFRHMRKNKQNLLQFVRELASLTPAEKDLIRHLLAGKKVAHIAAERHVEVSTVKTQITHILHKLNARRTQDVVRRLREEHLTGLFEDE